MAEEIKKIDAFSADLYQYLLERRMNLLIKTTPEKPKSDFHDDMGMAVLLESYRSQSVKLLRFARHGVPRLCHEAKYIASFATRYANFLVREAKNVFAAFVSTASLILELVVFCHLRGHSHLIFHSANLFNYAFEKLLADEFFINGGWKALMNYVAADAIHFKESGRDKYIRGIYDSKWLRNHDMWVFTYDPSVYEILPGQTVSEEPVQKVELSPKLLQEFKQKIAEIKDSACDQLFNILKSKHEKEILMNNYVFRDIIMTTIKEPYGKLQNKDILQIAKLILTGNYIMTISAWIAIQCIGVIRNKVKSTSTSTQSSLGTNHSEGGNLDSSRLQEKTILEETLPSQTKSCSQLGAIPKRKNVVSIESSPCEFHEKLLSNFKRVVSRNSDSFASKICEMVDSTDKAEILLGDKVFIELMKLTVNYPDNRWENEWILSVASSLIEANLKPNNPSRKISVPEDIKLTDITQTAKSRRKRNKNRRQNKTKAESDRKDTADEAIKSVTELCNEFKSMLRTQSTEKSTNVVDLDKKTSACVNEPDKITGDTSDASQTSSFQNEPVNASISTAEAISHTTGDKFSFQRFNDYFTQKTGSNTWFTIIFRPIEPINFQIAPESRVTDSSTNNPASPEVKKQLFSHFAGLYSSKDAEASRNALEISLKTKSQKKRERKKLKIEKARVLDSSTPSIGSQISQSCTIPVPDNADLSQKIERKGSKPRSPLKYSYVKLSSFEQDYYKSLLRDKQGFSDVPESILEQMLLNSPELVEKIEKLFEKEAREVTVAFKEVCSKKRVQTPLETTLDHPLQIKPNILAFKLPLKFRVSTRK